MTKVDVYLNEYILHMQDVLDVRFRVDGVHDYREHSKVCGCKFEDYIKGYSDARWYIFVSQN